MLWHALALSEILLKLGVAPGAALESITIMTKALSLTAPSCWAHKLVIPQNHSTKQQLGVFVVPRSD